MAQASQALGPQTAGAQGGVIPFWAASQNVIFDNFTSDSFTPGAAVKDLFQGALADIKSYGFLNRLWLKFVGTGGSTGGTLTLDSPMNALSLLRIQDPNGHAIFDADSFGLYLLNKYGGDVLNGDPADLPSRSGWTALGSTATGTPQFALLVPFCVNPEIGLGALSDMDASGPYQIIAQGNTSANVYSTAPTTTTPLLTINVGGEFFSLPAQSSRVNGQPQVFLPPLLDRGIAVVQEFTKQTLTGLQSGVPSKLRRVGNIISQIYLVPRSAAGARVAWGSAVDAGTRVKLAFDEVPLWDGDPVHLLDIQARARPRGSSVDTGVLVIDRRTPAGIALKSMGTDAGLDRLLQTAQNTDLTVTANWTTANVDHVDVYTSDITVTNLVTGEKYSFAYGGQLLLPTVQSLRG